MFVQALPRIVSDSLTFLFIQSTLNSHLDTKSSFLTDVNYVYVVDILMIVSLC